MESPRRGLTSFSFPVANRKPEVNGFRNNFARPEPYIPKNVHDTSKASSVIGNKYEEALSFEKIREICIQKRILFEDPDFPASDKSLFYSYRPNIGPIIWKRPYEIAAHPKFTVDGFSRFDLLQGKLGNCWLVAAFSCLTLTPKLLERCIPEDQGFTHKYAGIFHFRFWRYGEWIDVVIDDRLPTINGELIYLRSSDRQEFWPALFEKAYAKCYGSYENTSGGLTNWALQDLTGGVTENHQVYENPRLIQRLLDVSMTNASLVGTYISTNMTQGQRRRLSNGLVTGHAYSVTGYAQIPVKNGMIILIRLRNPWGHFEPTFYNMDSFHQVMSYNRIHF